MVSYYILVRRGTDRGLHFTQGLVCFVDLSSREGLLTATSFETPEAARDFRREHGLYETRLRRVDLSVSRIWSEHE